MKVVIADDLPASAVDVLRATGWTVDATRGRTAPQLAAVLADADAVIVRSATQVTSDLIAAAPRLRIVARAGTGIDNVDVEAATARGILVINAPGANSVSVAEHACALILALARRIPAADTAMKQGRWEKKRFIGAELRGKTLGIAGLGRIGQELARRVRAFGMRVVAHDPFIAAHVAADLGVEMLSLDELCAAADFLSLHLPSTPATRHVLNADRFALCKRGIRIVNTARGDLIDEAALADAIEQGIVAGAALDVFGTEPPKDWRLAQMPQVIATPHIAASTVEAQELVGTETAEAVRDFLRDGTIRNAVNFPAIGSEELRRVRPFMRLAERLGALLGQTGVARIEGVGIRYYGELAGLANTELLSGSVLAGALKAILSGRISVINSRQEAQSRGIEIVESRSSRVRPFTSLLSVKLRTDAAERWVEGTIFEHGRLRLVSIDGVDVDAPLDGVMLVIHNDDRPGVIGEVGGILGRHGINIANFALGRGEGGAVGVVNVDATAHANVGASIEAALDDIRRVPAVRDAWMIRLE